MTRKANATMPGNDPHAAQRIELDAARAEPYRLDDLIRIMAVLRTPAIGCPWDIEQDFWSIAPYTLEEAYEVADAIERGDLDDLREELGDLLLQVVYHARMAEEQGSFAFADVVDGISRKMVRRHPHVFGEAEIRGATEVKGLWDRIKHAEKAEKRNGAPLSDGESLLDSVPAGLPALTRAVKLQHQAAKIGFDWATLKPVFEKLKEEIAELEAEIADGGAQAIAEEYGDILFVLSNVARHLRLDPEAALRRANAKFARRFKHVERRLREDGRPADQVRLDEMDAWWNEAKAAENAKA
jgi:MazG family protein